MKIFILIIGFFLICPLASVSQSPGNVSTNLNLWLKANAGTGAIGTSWQDQSGNANDYTTVTGPTLQSNAINFNPAIEILSGGFNAPAGAALGTDWTTFFVSQKLASDNNGRLFDGHSGNYLWAYWGTYRNSIYLNTNPANHNSGIATTTGIQDVHLFAYARESTGGTLEARTDGESLNTFGSSNSANGIQIDINQGAFAGETSDSRVAEMIVYSAQLSAADINKVESYLAVKYGITLDNGAGGAAGDYTASGGTILWDASANTTYHNDVTGIGRDDNSGLDQQKSTSSNATGVVTMDKGNAFGTDGDFILWGNDNAAKGISADVDLTSFDARLNKIWRVAVSGTPGVVDFSINLKDLGLPTALSATDYALLIDADGTFATGATTHTIGATINGDTLSFTGVNFTDGDYFTIAANNIEAPGNVTSNLRLWLKANAGIIGVAPITNWQGQWNGYDATVPTNGPDLVTDGLNFNPTLDFTRSNSEYLSIVDGILGTDTYSHMWVYYVSKSDILTTNTVFNESLTGADRFAALNVWSNSHVYFQLGSDGTGGGGGRINGLWGGTLGNFNMWTNGISSGTATPNGTKKAISRDGAVILSNTNNDNSVTGNNQPFYIGGRWTGANNFYMDGQLAELIIYTSIPTPLEQEKVQSYLAVKYGLTKNSADNVGTATEDEQDYFASDGTVIWDYSTNTTYHNDVAGIGKDDASALDQQKSISSNATAAVTMDKGGAFGTDGDFILWGNDGATNGASTDVDLTSYDIRLNKVWKVAISGTPGTVDFSIDLNSLGFPTALNASDYTLLIDSDGVFATGAAAHTAGAAINNGMLSFTGVSFSDGDFFTIAASNLVGPGDVTGNLQLWLKANAGMSTTTDGAIVAQWNDQSPEGNNAIHASGSDSATYMATTHNFNPSVYFANGDNGYFDVDLEAIKNSDYNLIAIVERDNNNTSNYFLGTNLAATNQGLHFGYRTNTQATLAQFGNDVNVNVNAFDNLTQSISLLRGQLDQTTGKIISELRDQTTSTNSHSNTNPLTGSGPGRLGRGTASGFEGSISEVIVYSSTLTDQELSRIYSYLAVKYGLTLDTTGGGTAGDYVASDGTTIIWDASANATYHNDVTGIGRDDASALDQQKSKSSNTSGVVTMDKGTAFPNDKGFILWGNNGAINGTSNDVDLTNYDMRLNKVWKVAVTGTLGTVDFSIDLKRLGLPTTLSATDYALLIDADGTFATGAAAHTTGATITNGVLSFTGVSLSDGDFFTIAANNVLAPGSVSDNLRLWLKANANVTGTAPITNWQGQWNGYDATVPTNGPDLVTDGLNFNPTLDFTSASQEHLSIVGGILDTDSYTDMWVYYISQSDVVQNNTIFNENLTGTERFASLNVWSNNNVYSVLGSTAGWLNGNWGGSIGEFNLWTLGISGGLGTPNGTRKAISRDGSVILSNNNTDATVTGNNQPFYIGGRWTGANNSYMDGQLAELIVYTDVPSPLEQEKVQSYLAVKYGLTKNSADNVGTATEDERDYFASDGTVIWDYSTNTTYHNDVAGVGRDDDSGLDQQKSISSNSTGTVTMDKGSAFGTDGDFILWGNDAAANGSSSDVDLTSYDIRLNKVWKVAVSGTPGTVNFSINLSGLGFPSALNATDYAILIDGDGVFATGATAHTMGATINSGVLSFTGVSLSDGDFFTIAATNIVAPGDVTSNLRLWLKADADVAGATPITGWNDQSGFGHDATVPVSGPDVVIDGLNFNPTLDFTSASSEYLEISGGILDTDTYNDMWVYAVSKSDMNQNQNLFLERLVETNNFASLHPWSNGQMYYDFGGRLNGAWGGTFGEFNTWTFGASTVMASTPNGTRRAISRNGQVILSNNVTSAGTGTDANFNIGSGYDGSNSPINFLDGQLAELIVYTSVPSPLEQEKVQSYLAIKYGLTKNSDDNAGTVTEDEQDYFASDGTVIWDYSTNTAYHNDVAGVGRDDDSGLDQQKSISSNSTRTVTMDKGGTFANDGDFILWGNDGAANGTSSDVDLTNYDLRLNKVWKVAVTGTPGTVNFSIDLADTGFPLLLNTTATDYALLIDGDGIFNTGATPHTAGASISGNILSFTGVNFSDGDYFTIALSNIKAPGGISEGLTTWLMAAYSSTSTQDAVIDTWTNHFGENATKLGASDNAIYKSVIHNYNPSVYFANGNNGYFDIDLSDIRNSDYNVFGVIERTSNKNTNYFLGTSSTTLNNGLHFGYRTNTIATLAQFANDVNVTVDAFNVPDTSIALLRGQLDQSVGQRVDEIRGGVLLSNTNTNTAPLIGSAPGRVGRGFGTSGFIGYSSEVIAYNKTLTNDELTKINTYLAIKYGMTIPNNYLASDGTVIWDYSASTNYNNDIIGIGRDDKSNLEQKQSHQVDDTTRIYISTLTAENASNTGTFASDLQFVILGHNAGKMVATAATIPEKPVGIYSRLEREWKVTNTNFTGDYSIELKLEVPNADITLSDLRLLVDDDGDFSDATIIGSPDVTFSFGSIIISGIGTAEIPANSTRYITLASAFANTPLPIELIHFSATPKDNDYVLLNWQTATEIDNDFFVIERSTNGLLWEELTKVDGAGNSFTTLNYSVKDNEPHLGISYYRLKQVDFNGQFSYSEIASVTIEDQMSSKVNIFPNPTNNLITIEGNQDELEQIEVYTLLGKNITSLTSIVIINEQKTAIDLSSLNAGVYVVTTKTTVNQVIKQ